MTDRLPRNLLDGKWKIAFDKKNIGKRQHWFAETRREFPYSIKVPGVWNEINPDYEGVAWYRRKFVAGREWENVEAELYFGAVDYFAEVWLNSHYLGRHEGGHTPFFFRTGRYLRVGENTLVVRVVDPPARDILREIDGFRMIEIPCGKQHWYHNSSGIWQSVSIRATGCVWLKNLFVLPDVRNGAISVLIDVNSKKGTGGTLEFIITRADNGQTVMRTEQRLIVKTPFCTLKKILKFPVKPALWNLENPFLYRLTVRALISGERSDEVATNFGMREFAIKGQRFLLNGEPVRLRGFLNQQWYPIKLAFPADEAACRRELQMVKDANCNLMRMHIRPALPRLLELADEMGVLIYEEPAIGWIAYSSQVKRRCLTEIQEMVLRDRNHPSVVLWGIFNEGGCRGRATEEGYSACWERESKSVRNFDESFVSAFQRLDPTRPIILDSGCLEWTLYFNGRDPHAKRLFDYHAYRASPTPDAVRTKLRHYGNNRQPLFISEYGSGGLPDIGKVVARFGNPEIEYCDLREYRNLLKEARAFYSRELKEVFPSLQSAIAATQRLQADTVKTHTENLRANPYCQGIAICQQTDAGPECEAGLADIWRNPKTALRAMKHACQPLYPAIDAERHNLYPGEVAHVEVNVINDTNQNKWVTLYLEVSRKAGKIAVSREQVEVPIASVRKRVFAIDMPETPGDIELKASLFSGRNLISQNMVILNVIAPSKLHLTGLITLIDFANHYGEMSLWRFLAALGARVERYPGFLNASFSDSSGRIILFSPIENLHDLADKGVASALEKVRRGRVGIVLGLPFGQEPVPSGPVRTRCSCQVNDFPSRPFGIPLKYVNSEGGALGFFHYVKKHPVFKGLPTRCIIGNLYANVCPTRSLYLPGGAESIAGCFAAPVLYHANAMHHPNVPGWREGQDLCIIRYGHGKLIFSQFNIVENLGLDPVAETLLVNLLNWAMTLTGKGQVPSGIRRREFIERISDV